MCNEEEKDMAISNETVKKVHAFGEMRKLIQSELKAKGMSGQDIKKELPNRFNGK